MANPYVLNRLAAIQRVLLEASRGGSGLANAAIGNERESFVNLVLGNVVAPPFRIGTGEITDHSGNLSGQVDIVIEYSNTISFPMLHANASRLYLAESVCCVIEVKSDLASQWNQVRDKAKKLSAVSRSMGAGATIRVGPPASKTIPLFAIGFKGWKEISPVVNAMALASAEAPSLSGALILDSGLYVGLNDYQQHTCSGPQSIFGFLLSLEQLTSSMVNAKPNLAAYITG